MSNLLHKCVLFVLAFLVATQALAVTVFDPTNFAKNTVTAAQSVKSVAVQVSQYSQMLRDYMRVLQNLRQLNPTTLATGVALGLVSENSSGDATIEGLKDIGRSSIQIYGDLHRTINGVDGLYKDIDRFTVGMNRSSVALNRPWTEVLADEMQRAQYGQDMYSSQYRAFRDLMNRQQVYQKRLEGITNQIPKNEGMQQSLSTLNYSMVNMTEQMTNLNQAVLLQAQSQSYKNWQESVDAESTVEKKKLRNNESKQLYQDLKNFK